MERRQESHTRKVVYAALFAALTAASALPSLMFPEVPITLQSFFAMLAGAVLGPYYGALSMLVYVLLGLVGLPVYAGGQAGLGVVVGPAGGYLIGFIPGAAVVGLMVRSKPKPGIAWLLLSMAAGTLIIYLCGIVQLYFITGWSIGKILVSGFLLFVPFDALKIVAAALIAKKIEV